MNESFVEHTRRLRRDILEPSTWAAEDEVLGKRQVRDVEMVGRRMQECNVWRMNLHTEERRNRELSSHPSFSILDTIALALVGRSRACEPTQSCGTGTHQGEDASMSTKRGENTAPHTGRNEHSGSATGAVRGPKQSEPEADKGKGSHQLGSHSSHEAKTGGDDGHGKAGARTGK